MLRALAAHTIGVRRTLRRAPVCDAARASQQVDKFPTPVMTAWWLATDVPFEWNAVWQTYMPAMSEDLWPSVFYVWVQKFVDKVKGDLISIGMWDR